MAFAIEPNPDFLYNEACANLRLGDLERAAELLGRAITMAPGQADDARRDPDFAPHRGHPAIAALLGPT